MDWKALLLGLLLGWVIEWIMDWYFWRSQGSGIKQEDFDRLKAEKEDAQSHAFAVQDKLNAEMQHTAALQAKVQAQTEATAKLQQELESLKQALDTAQQETQTARDQARECQNTLASRDVELQHTKYALQQAEKPTLLEGLTGAASGIADKIKDFSEKTLETVQQSLHKEPEKAGFLDGLKNILEQAKDKIGAIAEGLGEKAQDVMEEARESLDSAKAKAADVLDNAKENLSHVGEKLKDTAQVARDKAARVFAEASTQEPSSSNPVLPAPPKGHASSQHYSTLHSHTLHNHTASSADQSNVIEIVGIGEVFAKRLANKGVYTLSDLLKLSSKQIEDAIGATNGRVAAEDWLKQARDLLNKQVGNG